MAIVLSVLMITKNSDELLDKSLFSASHLADEIVIVDDFSEDKTTSIAKKYKSAIFRRRNSDLGAQRAFGLNKCRGEWILMLDADEILSEELIQEIKVVIGNDTYINGYSIPYQNHLFGKPIYYGGENYCILRLFRRNYAIIKDSQVHEHVEIRGKTQSLSNKVFHYSYRSLFQIIAKFTDYAKREAKKKAEHGEKSSLRKLILYPLHMVWARYIKDQGYKDGLVRILLDLAFGYMEFCTYLFLLFEKRKK